MTDIDLSQTDADFLIALPKYAVNRQAWSYPSAGGKISVPLQSEDRREAFRLDLWRARLDLVKSNHQTRARQVYPLIRLCIGTAPHRNPDGALVGPVHIHHHREGYGDKWAGPLPDGVFGDLADQLQTLNDFMQYCNIVEPPIFQAGGMP